MCIAFFTPTCFKISHFYVSYKYLYLKDFEASNIEDANKGGPLSAGSVQGFVNSGH